MPRRVGALAPRPAEDWEDILNDSEPHSPRSRSRSYPNVALCVIVAVVLGVVFLLGSTGSNHLDYDKSGRARRVQSLAFKNDDLDGPGSADEDEGPQDVFALNDGLWQRSKNTLGTLSAGPRCRAHICGAISILREVYGNALQRTLHVGPGTCGVVSEFRKQDDVEVWGVQPFDFKRPIHSLCEIYIHKGLVRVSDPYLPLPYRKKSFSFVLVTDILEQMTTKELNSTLLDIAGVASHGVVFVAGNGAELSTRTGILKSRKLKPRNRLWWQRRFAILGLKEDEERTERFEKLQLKNSFKTASNIFHLHAPGSSQDSEVIHDLLPAIPDNPTWPPNYSLLMQDPNGC